MKVVDLISQLNKIGYNEDTELTFSCVNGDTGEWYDLEFEQIDYGEVLTGDSYNNDIINISIDVDSAKEYLNDKVQTEIDALIEDINEVFRRRF